jgi:hypothetical protein
MRRAGIAFLVSLVFLTSSPVVSQQTPTSAQRDSKAVALLQQSVLAMGGTVPPDSVATGSVTIVAGSLTSNGTIRILTRGTSQTSEQILLPESSTTVTYSGGFANQTVDSTTTGLSLERAATAQSVCFPLPFLAGALANLDVSLQYVGLETLNQQSVQHFRLQNSFASQRIFQQLAEFAVFDVWLDASSALPARISFVRRDGGGSVPRIPMDAYFTNYRTVSGIAYPSQISISLNGTPWTTVTISNVAFNTGLSDSNFSIQ